MMLQCHTNLINASALIIMTIDKLAFLRQTFIPNNLDGFLVPRADNWTGEFISKRSERLAWLSGFSGSAGIGIVLNDKAVVLTDGRYTLQVKDQIDGSIWDSGDSTKVSFTDWLSDNAKAGARIGFDPFLHSVKEIETAQEKLQKKNITLQAVTANPIDDLWDTQPEMPMDAVTLFPENLAGRSCAQKISTVTDILKNENIDQFFFTMPDSIAWLLNIRGNDVEHTPVPLSYGLLKQDGTFDWFINPSKVPENVTSHLGDKVRLHSIDSIEEVLSELEGTTGFDHKRGAYYFVNSIPDPTDMKDPCIDLKACKNDAEQEAIRTAHIHDGQVLIEFHRWLKDNHKAKLDELKIEAKLQEFRQKNKAFISPSFDTISGFQGNGAIIHYRATPKTSKKIKGEGLLLVDSGAQYMCEEYAGTTDVTRTYIIGTADNETKFHYTTVLRAHIAIAKARFPYGATGIQIDAIARSILWQEGLDFAHGLGHGVGCFLNVHEEASNLSPRGEDKLEPGMLLSNEPGLYLEDKYGIRIENLMLVQKTGDQDVLGRDILCFETVTLAPYDNDAIDFNLLNGEEMKWLQDYYSQIEEKLKI